VLRQAGYLHSSYKYDYTPPVGKRQTAGRRIRAATKVIEEQNLRDSCGAEYEKTTSRRFKRVGLIGVKIGINMKHGRLGRSVFAELIQVRQVAEFGLFLFSLISAFGLLALLLLPCLLFLTFRKG
jgi:hypothetical protein